jgi:hypothetical protein
LIQWCQILKRQFGIKRLQKVLFIWLLERVFSGNIHGEEHVHRFFSFAGFFKVFLCDVS